MTTTAQLISRSAHLSDRTYRSALLPVGSVVVEVDGQEFVAGDALFTTWMSRSTGVEVTDFATRDRLDAALLARRSA